MKQILFITSDSPTAFHGAQQAVQKINDAETFKWGGQPQPVTRAYHTVMSYMGCYPDATFEKARHLIGFEVTIDDCLVPSVRKIAFFGETMESLKFTYIDS